MMERSTAVIGTVLTFWAVLVVQGHCHTPFFIFGDSLMDAGNNQYYPLSTAPKKVWPFGMTFPIPGSDRVCDGRLIPDFLAQYANMPFIKPYLEPGFTNYTDGANFASAGGAVLAENSPNAIYLKLQLSYFEHVKKKLEQQEGHKKTQELLSKAVYLLGMGGNDYMRVRNVEPPLTSSQKKEYVTMVLSNITSTVKKVYAMGGRKFLFQSVGPLGCMPTIREGPGPHDCDHVVMSIAKMHNTALSIVLQKLEKTLPGFKYSMFDYYSTLAAITNYAPQYGFEEGPTACCGSGVFNGETTCAKTDVGFNLCHDPTKYVWFDGVHPSDSANKYLSALFWNGSRKVVWPIGAKELFHMP